ncbi:MAG: ribosomal-processing cysteine protease Prp [Candidatus Tyrphobacter sp.]
MLDVIVYRDARKRVFSIVARGHAHAGAHGRDIVCAAASAILQTARLGLERHVGLRLEATAAPGEFAFTIPQHAVADPAVDAIVATAELGLRQIASQYPKHVRVKHRTKTG